MQSLHRTRSDIEKRSRDLECFAKFKRFLNLFPKFKAFFLWIHGVYGRPIGRISNYNGSSNKKSNIKPRGCFTRIEYGILYEQSKRKRV
jgi:hypothetical protein